VPNYRALPQPDAEIFGLPGPAGEQQVNGHDSIVGTHKIAAATGKPPATIRSNLRHARSTLKELMQPGGE
jgi:hypothetical protein